MTAKEIKSAYNKTVRKLKATIKTAEKYNGKTVSIPERPKKITAKSLNRVQNLLETQKKINRILPKQKKVTIKYYYTDKTGKRQMVATQNVELEIPTRFKNQTVHIKNFKEFMENEYRLNTMSKMHEIGDVLKMARGETNQIMTNGKQAREQGISTPFKSFRGYALLGDGSVRQKAQGAEMESTMDKLLFALSTNGNKVPDDVRAEVDKLVQMYEEFRTYYRTDDQLEEIVNNMEILIEEIDREINGLTSEPFEQRYIANSLQQIMLRGNNLK